MNQLLDPKKGLLFTVLNTVYVVFSLEDWYPEYEPDYSARQIVGAVILVLIVTGWFVPWYFWPAKVWLRYVVAGSLAFICWFLLKLLLALDE